MIYKCCDEKRKAAVLGNPTLNGIDYLEVLGFDAQRLGLAPHPGHRMGAGIWGKSKVIGCNRRSL